MRLMVADDQQKDHLLKVGYLFGSSVISTTCYLLELENIGNKQPILVMHFLFATYGGSIVHADRRIDKVW